MSQLKVLEGGEVIDGRGKHERADVWLEGDRIAAVHWGGSPAIPEGATVWRVDGLTTIPGLVDMHSHDDVAAADPERIEAKLRQGVTTVLIGADGLGYAPLESRWRDTLVRYWRPVDGDPGDLWAETLEEYRQQLAGRLLVHVVPAVPHGNLRVHQAGFVGRQLSKEKLAAMARQVETELEMGAYGLTTGLSYVPAASSNLEELLSVCAPLRHRGIYSSHLRDYWLHLFEAVDEAAELGRRLDIRVHLSHLHLSHPAMFGRAEELLHHLEEIARQGVALSWDIYPYSAGSSILHSFLPRWFQDGGPEDIWRRLHEEFSVQALEHDPAFIATDWSKVMVSGTLSGNYVGHTVASLVVESGVGPAQLIARLLREEELVVSGIVHQSLETDDLILAEGFGAVVGSDGLPYGQQPHPRHAGAFAAFYRRHVRERRTFSPSQAIERMSAGPAHLAGLTEQGEIAPGKLADLAVMDLDRYTDRSTYDDPFVFADGVKHVFVAGDPIIQDARMNTHLRPGRVIACR